MRIRWVAFLFCSAVLPLFAGEVSPGQVLIFEARVKSTDPKVRHLERF